MVEDWPEETYWAQIASIIISGGFVNRGVRSISRIVKVMNWHRRSWLTLGCGILVALVVGIGPAHAGTFVALGQRPEADPGAFRTQPALQPASPRYEVPQWQSPSNGQQPAHEFLSLYRGHRTHRTPSAQGSHILHSCPASSAAEPDNVISIGRRGFRRSGPVRGPPLT